MDNNADPDYDNMPELVELDSDSDYDDMPALVRFDNPNQDYINIVRKKTKEPVKMKGKIHKTEKN
jgi:hypothetical protein